jgi:CMP-N-acetylneuraminic acid synthetase
MNLCYIQARAGSKRFPKKALALWNGKPMVADAIEKAQATGLFDYIAVSSDDTDVLQIAVDYGVLPLWRSPATASDTATDDDVASEVLRYFPDATDICKVYPCIPLLTTKDIIEIFIDYRPYHGAYFCDLSGKDAGCLYRFNMDKYYELKTISLKGFPWVKIPIENACDINTPEDLEIAKKKAGL